MLEQIQAIVWAQFRITRNHFPRTSFGTVLSWTVSALWYSLFVIVALVAARGLERTPDEYLTLSVSIGLLLIFGYMQIIPLATVSGGWSLQLDKLQPFPISARALFMVEVVLRVTSAPEMMILLSGGFLGLWLRPDVPRAAPFCLLFFLPFSLLLQLAIRDFILHSFARNRFRELLAVIFMAIALLPQLLVRGKVFQVLKPYLLIIANGEGMPWHEVAVLSVGRFSLMNVLAILGWNAVAAVLAWAQFAKSLRQEDSFRPAARLTKDEPRFDFIGRLANQFPDPFGAVVEKELRSMVRMPRVRVLFGMACVFSLFVFLPMAIETGERSFMAQNLLPVTSLYGLLLLSDALLLNIFGFDRAAAQLYFVTPLRISVVIRAKNLTAILFIAVQTMAIPALSMMFRLRVTWLTAAVGVCSSAVATVFLLSAGNLLSVYLPRPIDARSAFRKQGGSKVQLWLLACTVGMFFLVGFAFLARWATDRDWVLLAVLGFEFGIGLIVYRFALEEAVERAVSRQEEIVGALGRDVSPVSG